MAMWPIRSCSLMEEPYRSFPHFRPDLTISCFEPTLWANARENREWSLLFSPECNSVNWSFSQERCDRAKRKLSSQSGLNKIAYEHRFCMGSVPAKFLVAGMQLQFLALPCLQTGVRAYERRSRARASGASTPILSPTEKCVRQISVIRSVLLY